MKGDIRIKYEIKEVVFYPDYYYEDDVPDEVALSVRLYVDRKVTPQIKTEGYTGKDKNNKKIERKR